MGRFLFPWLPLRGTGVYRSCGLFILGDLCTCKWSVTSTGKIQVESKDEVRKRLGRSTDVGDAVAQAFTVSSAEAVYVDMSPVPIARDMSGLFTPDPKWGRGPLFEEPREYPNVERIEGREADRFPGSDDPPPEDFDANRLPEAWTELL